MTYVYVEGMGNTPPRFPAQDSGRGRGGIILVLWRGEVGVKGLDCAVFLFQMFAVLFFLVEVGRQAEVNAQAGNAFTDFLF